MYARPSDVIFAWYFGSPSASLGLIGKDTELISNKTRTHKGLANVLMGPFHDSRTSLPKRLVVKQLYLCARPRKKIYLQVFLLGDFHFCILTMKQICSRQKWLSLLSSHTLRRLHHLDDNCTSSSQHQQLHEQCLMCRSRNAAYDV